MSDNEALRALLRDPGPLGSAVAAMMQVSEDDGVSLFPEEARAILALLADAPREGRGALHELTAAVHALLGSDEMERVHAAQERAALTLAAAPREQDSRDQSLDAAVEAWLAADPREQEPPTQEKPIGTYHDTFGIFAPPVLREQEPCGTCGGVPPASGKTCVCKGTNLAWQEAQGLRELLYDAHLEIDRLREQEPKRLPREDEEWQRAYEDWLIGQDLPESPPVHINAAGVSSVRPVDVLRSKRGREQIEKSRTMMKSPKPGEGREPSRLDIVVAAQILCGYQPHRTAQERYEVGDMLFRYLDATADIDDAPTGEAARLADECDTDAESLEIISEEEDMLDAEDCGKVAATLRAAAHLLRRGRGAAD